MNIMHKKLIKSPIAIWDLISMNISHYKNYHSFGEVKSIKLRFSPYFCKPVVKNGLKTWLNIDINISLDVAKLGGQISGQISGQKNTDRLSLKVRKQIRKVLQE